MSDEPLWCSLCGAEDWSCGHGLPLADPSAETPATDHGPRAYCEAGGCRLWTGERCEYCGGGPS